MSEDILDDSFISLDGQALPFIKWAGGKRWLAAHIIDSMPELDKTTKYFEPFAGSSALFFKLRPHKALLSDVNEELTNCYQVVRDSPEALIAALSSLKVSKKLHNKMRQQKPEGTLGRAVRFIYLNRTSYNGLYRVNKQGDFNVPFGCKPGTKVCDARALLMASQALKSAKFVCADFEASLKQVRRGDIVYCDPPYTSAHNQNAFRRYNERLFSWDDQLRLASVVRNLLEQGAWVAISNANAPDVQALYDDFMEVTLVDRWSGISGKQSSRLKVQEALYVPRKNN